MRIALAQLDPIVGDIAGNTRLIQRDLAAARAAGAELVLFPELAVIGYPPKDLLLKPSVIAECVQAVQSLAAQCTDFAAIIGYPCPSDDQKTGRPLYNAAAFCHGGRVARRHVKSLLPTYDVFDESRYFEPGPRVDLTPFAGLQLGISVCEDLWNDAELFSRQLYHDNPVADLAAQGADLFINCSASPFVVRKHAFRLKLLAHAARRYHLPVLYCNQVGGNDELIFDGNSCAFDAQGNLLAHAKDFQEDLLLVDLDLGEKRHVTSDKQEQSDGATERRSDGGEEPANGNGGLGERRHQGAYGSFTGRFAPGEPSPTTGMPTAAPQPATGSWQLAIGNRLETPTAGIASIYHALVLGLKDYCRKCGFKSVVLGLSGGIDSAVTGALAVAALGPQNVRGVAMPSCYSSEHSLADARDLAQRLGLKFAVIPIEGPHRAFVDLLTPHFEGRPPDTTEENVQARIRGVILMALSNKFGSLLVTTGNKSEVAVGYCTLYGDMAGGLAVISDVPKTVIWELARWINTPACPLHGQCGRPPIPESSITKAPSAELRPNQTDQDTLPPYEVLDQIIERYVEREQSARDLVADLPTVDPKTILRVIRMIDVNEYKRKQSAPGLKVTGRAFGFGRRMPIAQRYDSSRSLGAQ